jgi:hypothetical protein
MNQIPSWESNSRPATQEISCPLWKWTVNYRVHNSPPLFPKYRKKCRNTNYIIEDVNCVLGLLHRVIMDDAAHVSEVHTASIFMIELRNFDRIQDICTYFLRSGRAIT